MRTTRDWSQSALSRATGIPARTLQRLEAGEIPHPKLYMLVDCALALDCSLEEILEDDWLTFSEPEEWRHRPGLPDPRGKRARVGKRSPRPR